MVTMTTAKAEAERISFDVDEERRVSGLWLVPKNGEAVCVLAHGAGAGMSHPFLEGIAHGLTENRIGTLRYQFPYMDRGSRRPDPPKLAQATVRAAVGEAKRRAGVPLFAGGKSFGGRMTSQAAAAEPLAGIAGIVFLGFPLHPPGKPGDERGDHLAGVTVPMLFLQGSRDEFADPALLKPLITRLGERATLHIVEDGNHSFRVPAKTGRKGADVLAELVRTTVEWIAAVKAT